MSTPKTGEALREEIEATLRTAHEQRVDLDALTHNVEGRLQEWRAAILEQPRAKEKHRGKNALFAGALATIVFAFVAMAAGFRELAAYSNIPSQFRATPHQIIADLVISALVVVVAVVVIAAIDDE